MIHNEPLISLFMHYTNPEKYSDSGSFLVGKDVTQFEKCWGPFSRQNRFPRLLQRIWGQAILLSFTGA
jgi:hypothetical protein